MEIKQKKNYKFVVAVKWSRRPHNCKGGHLHNWWDEGAKSTKNEKCTCKACKSIVKYADFWRCCPYRCDIFSSLLENIPRKLQIFCLIRECFKFTYKLRKRRFQEFVKTLPLRRISLTLKFCNSDTPVLYPNKYSGSIEHAYSSIKSLPLCLNRLPYFWTHSHLVVMRKRGKEEREKRTSTALVYRWFATNLSGHR